jgi:hypothetical protein
MKVKVKVVLRPTVSYPLSWSQAPIWNPRPIFLLLSLIIFRQVCWYGAPSLTRSRVCRFQLLRGFAIAVFLGSEPHETNKLHGLSPRANYTDRVTAACRRSDCQLILLWQFLRLSQPGGPGSCIYFPQKQGRLPSYTFKDLLFIISWHRRTDAQKTPFLCCYSVVA